MDAVANAVEKVGLEPGRSVGAMPGMGDVVLANVGGIYTTLKSTGQIIVTDAQGRIILNLFPK